VLAHGALAIGLILISLIDRLRVDLTSLLFGDLLAATDRDLLVILALAVVGSIVMLRLWRPLLSLTVQPDLAQVEGIAATPTLLAFNLLLAGVIAVGMKLVGIVLVISLLIVPAAAARPWSRSPGMMAALAAVLGACSSALGVACSFFWDVPTGPAIVAAATAIFALSAGGYALTSRRRTPAVAAGRGPLSSERR
jgi:zinc transport system permease protein